MIEVHDEGVRFFRAALIGCAVSVPLWLLLIGAFYLACGGERLPQ